MVSQFTLYADTAKGRRPSWDAAAPGTVAEPLVATFAETLRELGASVESGVFGAHMQVELVNDGPVTVILEALTASPRVQTVYELPIGELGVWWVVYEYSTRIRLASFRRRPMGHRQRRRLYGAAGGRLGAPVHAMSPRPLVRDEFAQYFIAGIGGSVSRGRTREPR